MVSTGGGGNGMMAGWYGTWYAGRAFVRENGPQLSDRASSSILVATGA